jgi:hypothetical protein
MKYFNKFFAGRLLPPPARKVIVERLPELPEPPQDVHIERWLPYQDKKRKVILNPKPCDPIQCHPRNVVINWEKVKPFIKTTYFF